MSPGPGLQTDASPAPAGVSFIRALLAFVLGFCVLLGSALLLAWASMAT